MRLGIKNLLRRENIRAFVLDNQSIYSWMHYMKKKIFADFIEEYFPEKSEILLSKFNRFHQYLKEENSKVNLISRKTPSEDYWTLHFLDSILPVKHIDFRRKNILDFGTGGGLPGIPLKIIFQSSIVYLLDSKRKKIRAIENIIKKLDLKKCFTIVSRLEEMEEKWFSKFDVIVCRSVKILPKYKKWMFKLLKNDGEIILYKSRKLDDIKQFSKTKIFDVSHNEIGKRKIIKIKK